MSLKTLPFAAACAALFTLAPASNASVVINVGSAYLSDNAGVRAQAGTLLQLVDLGPNGIFDSINIADGTSSGLGRWVSGDDTVLNIAFQSIVGVAPVPGDFASTKAFDFEFNAGVVADSDPGFLNRAFQFSFSDLPAGMKLGLRWFPGLLAKDFDSITLASGQRYGQFTRQSPGAPINNGVHWSTPGDGANITFDPLVTNSAGGPEANSAGNASFTVVPEPAAIGMSLLGAAGLAMLRRRRA
jgi:hypothetical protein